MAAVFGVLLPRVVNGGTESNATFVARKWVQSLVGNGHPDIFLYGGMTETPTRTGGRPGIPAAMEKTVTFRLLPLTPASGGSTSFILNEVEGLTTLSSTPDFRPASHCPDAQTGPSGGTRMGESAQHEVRLNVEGRSSGSKDTLKGIGDEVFRM